MTNDGEGVATWDERRERVKAKGINGNGMGEPLTIAVQRLLPTPSANVGTNGGSQHPDKRRAGNHQPSIQDVAEHVLLPTPAAMDGSGGRVSSEMGGTRESGAKRSITLATAVHHSVPATDWGPYAPAIHRWEHVLGQPAPSPTEPNKAGKPRLSPRFTEWMMGIPAGWITDTPGVSRNDQLKAAGNGVVPQQAAAALADMLAAFGERTPATPNTAHRTDKQE